jgi:hypothetical protein
MPKNLLIRVGVLVIVASALMYLGAIGLNYIKDLLPWIGGGGVALLIVGVLMEAQKAKQAPSLDASTGAKVPKANEPVHEEDAVR